MSGNCYSCGTGFSFFKKEVGCKSCGFAFCKDCINGKKVPVPRVNNEKHKVCQKCYNIITGKAKPSENSAKYSPPEAYKKRIAALESGNAKPKQASPSVPRAAAQKPYYPPSMGKEDIALAERLEKLKESRKPDPATLPNQQQIEQRLGELRGNAGPVPAATDLAARAAVLQGKDPAAAAAKQASSSSGKGEVDDLLTQVMEEVELDNQALERFDEVENRLNRLKGIDTNKAAQPSDKPVVPTKDTRTFDDGGGSSAEHKQNDDELQALISQVAAELELDAQKAVDDLMKDKDIAARLAKVKDKKDRKAQDADSENQDAEEAKNDCFKAGPEADEDDEETEEEAVKRIIQQALEEQKLDEAAEEAELGFDPKTLSTATDTSQAIGGQAALGPPPMKPQMEDFEEEFPWCCICNEDASLRCHGCNDDLYCKRCYREGHERFEMEDHETSPFKQSGKKS